MVSLPSERATTAVKSRGKATGAYGHPKPIYDGIARLWSVYFGIPITAEQVAFAQVLLKVGRQRWGHHNEDNFTDVAGYADVAEMVLDA